MTSDNFIASGDEYFDALRAEVAQRPTDTTNFQERAVALKLWACTLQQLGADLKEFLEVDAVLSSPERDIVDFKDDAGGNQTSCDAVDRGFAILESILERAGFELPAEIPQCVTADTSGNTGGAGWPTYHGDIHHTGHTNEQGPTAGSFQWKFPISLGWKARPAVIDNTVYVASPGLRVMLYCLDKGSGDIRWKAARIPRTIGDQLYHTPSIASTPVVVGDEVVVREIGSRGSDGWARNLVLLDKNTGAFRRNVEACHIDYRAGYAQFAANERHIVYPSGKHDIEQTPPYGAALDTVVCKDFESGDELWSFFVGPMFGKPMLTPESVFVGTLHGDVFCLKVDGGWSHHRRERIRWYFKCDGAVNTTPVLSGQHVFFGSNDGNVYCLESTTGAFVWKWGPDRGESNAFRLYSSPLLRDGRLYVGSADGWVYCLSADSGALIWEYQVGEWVRSAPVFFEDTLIFASLDGTLHSLRDMGNEAELVWSTKICNHHIFSDLVECDGAVYVTSSDLYIHCVDAVGGKALWKRSLIESVEIEGVRIQTDQISGGAYYQSKPTASGNRAYIGTPSGFVHAIDESNGKEKWRFECGAAVSASPMLYEERIYFGQQGGEDWFYCLDSGTGELVWKQSIGWVWGSANAAQGRIFVPGIDGHINCLDAASGAILWRYRTSKSTCTEPVIDGDTVYFGGWDHYLYAFDLASGRLKWKFHVDGGCDSGTAIAKDGRIYLPSGGSNCFRCLDGQTGGILWEFCREKTNFNATPAFDGEHVYLSISRGRGLGGVWTYPTICCLDAKNGLLLWEHEGGGLTGPVVAGDSVYFGSTASPFFYCVDRNPAADGSAKLKWQFYLTNKMEESTPAIINGKALVLCDDGYLYAVT